MNFIYKKVFKSTKKVFSEIQARSVSQLPIETSSTTNRSLISLLANLLISLKSGSGVSADSEVEWLEWLVDACVMECYFRDHMAERDLLFLEELAPHLAGYEPCANEAKQREFLDQLHRTLNAQDSVIRDRLDRICTDSPELLAVIKEEGKV